jgi:hypothetical protein
MIDSIIGRVKKVIFKFCEKHAKKRGLIISDVQLLLGINTEGNTYTLCVKNVPTENYDIYDVLQIPKNLDFTGISGFAPQFIAKSILRFSDEKNLDPLNTHILCIPYHNERGKGEIALLLYEGTHEIQQITFDELFRPEDVVLSTE